MKTKTETVDVTPRIRSIASAFRRARRKAGRKPTIMEVTAAIIEPPRRRNA